ncbi:MAG: hypothetical protein M1832_003141 [Thelocarpon impressellum]|nr:MAG: hypothetical protein M1832_003141 [Thelocarpon impressellum]
MPSPATTVDADSDDISLDSIFAAALNADPTRRSSSDGLSFGPADPSPEQHDAAIARYPAPLRAAAARASSLSRLRPSASSPADPIERQRREELARIEGLLRGATTDIALWGVLESVIFPLVDKLAPSPPPPTKPSKRRGRVSKSPAPSFPAPQPSLSNLALVGSIYPSVLLLAFRLLAHTHNSPAACSALFGAIKARGPVSYVLGASTALHTEMILLAWRRFHDTDAVSALLAEMHDGGVDFDAATASALQEIIAQAQAGRAAPGAAGRAWQVRVQRGSLAQLVAWRDTVAAKLAAASADLSGAEEAVLAC